MWKVAAEEAVGASKAAIPFAVVSIVAISSRSGGSTAAFLITAVGLPAGAVSSFPFLTDFMPDAGRTAT